MWRLLKFLFFVVFVVVAVLAVTGHKIRGKTITEHFQSFLSRDGIKESVQDIRALVGEAIKAVGSEIEGDATESEQKELDQLIKKVLEEPAPEKEQKQIPPADKK